MKSFLRSMVTCGLATFFLAASANAQFFDFEVKGKKFGTDRTTYGTAAKLFRAINYPANDLGAHKHMKFVGIKKGDKFDKFLECGLEVYPPGVIPIRAPANECVVEKDLNQDQLEKLFKALDDSLIQPLPRGLPVGVALTKKAVGNFLWQFAVSRDALWFDQV